MKKEYMKPAMCVVELQHKTQLLQASQTNRVQTSGLDSGDRQQHLGQIIAITGQVLIEFRNSHQTTCPH